MKIFLLLSLLPILIYSQQSSLKTVEYVDLGKYAGLWYEVARIPNKFQNDCSGNVTARYSLMENGKIKVINSCIDSRGNIEKVEGVARVKEIKSNAKLEVSFFSILGWRPIWGDYWIIGLDENYQWAIVGTPSRKYGWILARSEKINIDVLEKIFSLLKSQGYNPDHFQFN